MNGLIQDLRYALRQLYKSPGFAIVAVLTMALGVGATAAIFGFVDAALLEPLPYESPNQLMSVNEGNIHSPRWPLSYPDFVDWQRLNHSFSSFDIYGGTGFLLRTSSGSIPVQAERVSGTFFETLGVHPMLGRDFYPGENRPGGPSVAILSYRTWIERFGANQDVVGQTLDLDNQAYTVIGVLPRTFSFAPAGSAELWVPLNQFSPHEQKRTFYNFWGIGRLRDGVTQQAALAEMNAIARQVQQQNGISGRNLNASVVPLQEIVTGDIRPILFMLLGGTFLLLIIACVNVSSLVLVRSESRRREIAVRGALGATLTRLVRQFITEGLLLAFLGTLVGTVLASSLAKILSALVPKEMALNMPFFDGVGLNVHTAIFIAGIGIVTAFLLAATPVVRLSLRNLLDGLAEGDRGAAGRFWQRLGANMVVAQLAIAVVLLVGAGLLGQSLYRLLHIPLGFEPDHLATVQVTIPPAANHNPQQTAELYSEISRRIAGLPGVESVGMTNLLPAQCNCSLDSIQIVGHPHIGEHNEVDERHVSANYLATLKAKLIRGRFFNDADDASKPGVVIINQSLAHKYFKDDDPIGQKISDDEGGRASTWEIVGIVDDIHEGPLDGAATPTEYFPLNQTNNSFFNLVTRTGQKPEALLPTLVSNLHQIGPSLGVSDEATMNAKIGGTESALLHQFSAWLAGGFSALALTLGTIGLYAMIAYSVSRRTREIGVRMAMGARRDLIYRLILSEAGRLAVFGLLLGAILSIGAGKLMGKLLFGVNFWDLPTLLAVSAVLLSSALLASYIPARRAAKVDPVVALRYE